MNFGVKSVAIIGRLVGFSLLSENGFCSLGACKGIKVHIVDLLHES